MHKYCYTNASGGGCNNPSPNSDQIGLYEHPDYCGAYKILGVGEYPNPGAIGLANDSISSVKVGSNVKAILCEHDGFQGRCEEFLNNDPNLSDNYVGNDSVSSVKVQSRVTTCPVPSPSSPNGARIPQTQSVNFTWSGSCSQYRVKYWGGPYSGELYSPWVGGSSWTPGTLWCGNYSWQVQGKSSSGAETGWSGTLNFTVAPNTPTGLTATAVSQSQINLSWNGVPGQVEGYKVYRNGSYIGSTTGTSYQATGLSCNTDYSFQVKAYAVGIDSNPSNTASARTHACPPQLCPAPGNLTATTLSQSSIRLGWQDTCGNEDSFKIYRNDTLVNTVGAGTTTWTDTGLSCGTTYSYYVKAHNAAGDSPASNTVSARTQNCPDTCPGGDAGNSFDGATLVYPPVDRAEYICPVNDEDWYRFSASTGQMIRVTLTSLPGDYDLYLYRPNASQANGASRWLAMQEHTVPPIRTYCTLGLNLRRLSRKSA
ncbi:MAG: fibronectin type III domain-containing protein [Anaerolineae bacterium]|nr:fibronectin type III domain-containing protein [Anaerolineae bacterium]